MKTVSQEKMVIQRTYICEECGKQSTYAMDIISCERKHLLAVCNHEHIILKLELNYDNANILEFCPDCCLVVKVHTIPETQHVLRNIIACIEEEKGIYTTTVTP